MYTLRTYIMLASYPCHGRLLEEARQAASKANFDACVRYHTERGRVGRAIRGWKCSHSGIKRGRRAGRSKVSTGVVRRRSVTTGHVRRAADSSPCPGAVTRQSLKGWGNDYLGGG